MKIPKIKIFLKTSEGFTLIELVVSLAIMSFLGTAIISFVIWMNGFGMRSRADAETLESARSVLDRIVYEIRGAKNIYLPTTSASQLSLETTHYLPDNEKTSFIDFYLCGYALCLKRESQEPIVLTPDSVRITSLLFSPFYNNPSSSSVQVNLTVSYNNYADNPNADYSYTLSATASTRSY